jgi:nucleoside-diphosphate-sugar epimerase
MGLGVLFIGGTGLISLPCVHEALAAGHSVTVFNRGQRGEAVPAGVECLVGDCGDPAALKALAARHFDLVCQFIAYMPAEIERDIALFGGRTGQYVFISSASAYRKPADRWPITEATPLENPFWEYSRRKAACEAVLAGQDRLPWTVVRPSHTVRTHFPTGMSERDAVASRLRRGLPVVVHGDGTSLWTLTRAEDFAVPFVRLFGQPAALGEAFHITADHAYSWNQIYGAIAAVLGVKAEIVHVPSDTLIRFRPDWTGPLLGDKANSAVFDNSKVKAVVGGFACARDLEVILAAPLAAYRARVGAGAPEPDPLDPVFDAVIAAQRAVRPAA